MSTSDVCSRFMTIYETLPDSAKRALLKEQLFPLIDELSSMGKIRILVAAESLRTRYKGLRPLDITAKKEEVDTLFDELRRDSYHGPNNSRREEITEEIVDSIITWLSDIWQTVYEYGVDFEKGHECLLYCCQALQQLAVAGSGCQCGFMNMYVSATIKDSNNVVIKRFSYTGAFLIEDAFLWIWRDMLLKILDEGKQCHVDSIPQILQDIQSTTKQWTISLDRLLIAGGKIPRLDEDINADYDDDDDDALYFPDRAAHWTPQVMDQLPALRGYIADTLFEYFKVTPSLALHTCIIALAPAKTIPLTVHLRKAVSYSGAAAAAALDIHTSHGDVTSILEVLDAARSVFRIRDAGAMQSAVHHLSNTKHVSKALEIVSRELRDCVESMRALVVNSAFGGVDKEENEQPLKDLMSLRFGTAQRQERVERWVDSVSATPAATGNPLTFAAFLMGFPPGFEPDDAEEPDPLLFSGIKDGHPDFEELRDEWRPRLKERFEGWVTQAQALNPGGSELLLEIHENIGDTMPYIRASDVVDEMISRIQGKPTKCHICNTLDALSSFVKAQNRKIFAEMTKANKRHRAAANAKNYATPGLEALD